MDQVFLFELLRHYHQSSFGFLLMFPLPTALKFIIVDFWWKNSTVRRFINENFPEHIFETQIHIQTQIRINTIFILATKHLMVVNQDNLYLHLKAFLKHWVLSCCVKLKQKTSN